MGTLQPELVRYHMSYKRAGDGGYLTTMEFPNWGHLERFLMARNINRDDLLKVRLATNAGLAYTVKLPLSHAKGSPFREQLWEYQIRPAI